MAGTEPIVQHSAEWLAARPAQRDEAWLVANKSNAAEVVRAAAAGELDVLMGRV